MSLDRRRVPVAAAWSPSCLEDGRLLPAWRTHAYFQPGGRTAPSQPNAMQFPPKAERTGNSYKRAGCFITSGSQVAVKSGRPEDGRAALQLLPVSPRFRESGTSGTGGVLSLLLPSRDGVTWRSPKAGRHVFTSLCSQQPLRPLKGTCDSLPDLKIFLITKKKTGCFLQYFGLSVRNNYPHLHVAASLMLSPQKGLGKG